MEMKMSLSPRHRADAHNATGDAGPFGAIYRREIRQMHAKLVIV